jgi:hypothetical protein
MATQRFTLATVAGEAASVTAGLFARWRKNPAPETAIEIDRFCDTLRVHCTTPPVIFFCEWIDFWSMGDRLLSFTKVEGTRLQVLCLNRLEAIAWADACGGQYEEDEWLAARLREAASVWCGGADRSAIVFVREVLGASITDEEVASSLTGVPTWLSRI